MRLLVTGIGGFIGSHLADRLVARGDAVVGLDNFDPFYDRRIKERNLAALRGHVELIEGDIRDAELLDGLMSRGGFDGVVHLAGLAGVRPSIAEPARYQDVNVVGSCRIAEAMVRHGIGRLVFASSSSVYGDNEKVPFHEDDPVLLPASPYAASKRACELLLQTYAKIHGLSSASLRFFTVYGPRQRPEMAIHKFCRLVDRGETLTMFGDGQSSRDYTFVDDIIDGCVGAIDHPPAGHSIYNLGNTHPVTLRSLISKIGQAVGREPLIRQAPMQPGDVLHTYADTGRAERDFGYAPKTDIDEGLRCFVAWMRAQADE